MVSVTFVQQVLSYKGYNKTKAFLAGPGPMQSTAADFWTMLWEKKSYTIIMLGQLKENEMVNILILALVLADCSIRKLHSSIGQLKIKVLNLESF